MNRVINQGTYKQALFRKVYLELSRAACTFIVSMFVLGYLGRVGVIGNAEIKAIFIISYCALFGVLYYTERARTTYELRLCLHTVAVLLGCILGVISNIYEIDSVLNSVIYAACLMFIMTFLSYIYDFTEAGALLDTLYAGIMGASFAFLMYWQPVIAIPTILLMLMCYQNRLRHDTISTMLLSFLCLYILLGLGSVNCRLAEIIISASILITSLVHVAYHISLINIYNVPDEATKDYLAIHIAIGLLINIFNIIRSLQTLFGKRKR